MDAFVYASHVSRGAYASLCSGAYAFLSTQYVSIFSGLCSAYTTDKYVHLSSYDILGTDNVFGDSYGPINGKVYAKGELGYTARRPSRVYVLNILRLGYRLRLRADPPLTMEKTSHVGNQHSNLVGEKSLRGCTDLSVNYGVLPYFSFPSRIRTRCGYKIHNLAIFNKHYLVHPPYFRLITLTLLRTRINAYDSLITLICRTLTCL